MGNVWEFIVYGQLPGTSIQISFENWLVTMAALVAVLLLRVAIRKRVFKKLRMTALGMYAAFVIKTSATSRLRLQA